MGHYPEKGPVNERQGCRFFYDSTALVGQGLLIIEASRPHTHTPHSVGLLWTSDRPDAETCARQNIQETGIHSPRGIRTGNPIKRVAAGTHLRPHGHWDLRGLETANNMNADAAEFK